MTAVTAPIKIHFIRNSPHWLRRHAPASSTTIWALTVSSRRACGLRTALPDAQNALAGPFASVHAGSIIAASPSATWERTDADRLSQISGDPPLPRADQ